MSLLKIINKERVREDRERREREEVSFALSVFPSRNRQHVLVCVHTSPTIISFLFFFQICEHGENIKHTI